MALCFAYLSLMIVVEEAGQVNNSGVASTALNLDGFVLCRARCSKLPEGVMEARRHASS
jgi:hypothetical protein